MTDWLQTFTGRKFYPFDPKPEDVCIEDIAHALSLKCRFGGHCAQFYSVAQHSVYVAFATNSLAGLLHDAAEAYMADIVTPIKRSLLSLGITAIRDAEDRIHAAIMKAFELPVELPDEVLEADKRMLATEHRDLMVTGPRWNSSAEPYCSKVVPWTPEESEAQFMKTFRRLSCAESCAVR